MKKIVIKRTSDILYYETLDNGMQIFMVPKDKVNNTFVSFNVKYGAMHNEFIPLGQTKMKKVPNGIAHFLEHKLFEQENGIDPMQFYAANGADVNAYTSLYNTSYHFSSSNHLKENLEYLLDFVQAPYFTDENVSKEKGIIEEEIKMYNDDPYTYLDERMRLNIFKNHPLRYSIAGSIDDIKNITKEDLYTCYNTFYHPTNMFMVISGKFDVKEILDIIKNNQRKKRFTKAKEITINEVKEPNEVTISYEEKEMNVEVSKISYGIKIPLKNLAIDVKKRYLYLTIMFDCLFGATSTFNEEMKDKGYLISNIGIDIFHTDKHILITISADTEHEKELLDAIEKRLTDLTIDEDDFNNKIKILISTNIYIYEDIDAINRKIVNDIILYNKYYYDIDDVIDSLNITELRKFIKQLNLTNTSTLIIKPIKKEGGV